MQRETKRDEVHESVRCCTLDVPLRTDSGFIASAASQFDFGRLEYGGHGSIKTEASNRTGAALSNGLNA